MNKNFPNYSEHMLITAAVIGAFGSLLKTITKPFYRKVYSLWDENVD